MLLIPAKLVLGIGLEQVLPLNRYSVEARYPGEWDPITRAEAEAAVAIARDAREAVRRLLPQQAL